MEWKLIRLKYGSEEYRFKVGDKVTIGRSLENTIALSSLVISRSHCNINFLPDKIIITDTGSSNGVYIGHNKIVKQQPVELKDSDIIGLGWTEGLENKNISLKENERFMFKLVKVSSSHRIKYQSENELDGIEEQLMAMDTSVAAPINSSSPILATKTCTKRKANNDEVKTEIVEKKKCEIKDDKIKLKSSNARSTDSDKQEISNVNIQRHIEKETLESITQNKSPEIEIKIKNESPLFEDIYIKQEEAEEEYNYESEPILIDSDSDSDSSHWYKRLSQNSYRLFSKMPKVKVEETNDENSYSQVEDNFVIDLCYPDSDEEEEYMNDIITIPPDIEELKIPQKSPSPQCDNNLAEVEIFSQDLISVPQPVSEQAEPARDEVDNSKATESNENKNNSSVPSTNKMKKTQMIQPQHHSPKASSKHRENKSSKTSKKSDKIKKRSLKRHTSNSVKEERKKKLKEIAAKTKESENQPANILTSLPKTTNVKVTSTNRGAFLTNPIQAKSVNKNSDHKASSLVTKNNETKAAETPHGSSEDRENGKKHFNSHLKKSEHATSQDREPSRTESIKKNREPQKPQETIQREKTSMESNTNSKNVCNRETLPPQTTVAPKKKVRFSDSTPQVLEYEIDPRNQMNKINGVKKLLVDIKKLSLETITLVKILRWNPSWLEEQKKFKTLPPILGHNNPPTHIYHAFKSHREYVQLVGDLLLMEIWENLSVGYQKITEGGVRETLPMQIENLSDIPPQERSYELYNLSVNVSVPSTEIKRVPRMGDVLLINFAIPDNNQMQKLFYVNNVRCLPSPPNNIYSFFSISLYSTYTNKFQHLRRGGKMVARTLTHITKELNMIEAMEYMASSALKDAILCPLPKHFVPATLPPNTIANKWIRMLNPSQQAAVRASVAAALGDKPSIQLVQGPPGTGKSSVICAIVMSYFLNEIERRHPNRGKILICATSNAAVDELVIRLLNFRQSLPRMERFRMVRVGRMDAMAPRARDISSEQLAQRDLARQQAEPAHTHVDNDEIILLEAKMNMWKTQAQDPLSAASRIAYCQTKIKELEKKISMLKVGCGSDNVHPEHIINVERRIIERADIIVTTLASAYSHKMRGLKHQIALCIIDEAGQALEPETLLPLTLDVQNLTLIGDPQQLPGYLSSKEARKHGLGESLFSRLISKSEVWDVKPTILLNQQYRMQADIAEYPNMAFYGGVVKTSVGPRPKLPIPPYTILSISSGDRGQGAGGENEMEAWGVARLVFQLHAVLRDTGLSLAVISPYKAHKELIKKHLKTLQGPAEPAIEVNTVDSFQGQERDVVVASLARSHGVGFLVDAGRMNVMLTRAKHALVLCLNPHAMMSNHQWRTLIEDAHRRKMYRALPNELCQPVNAEQAARVNILEYLSTPKK